MAPNYQPSADFALTSDHLIEEDSMLIWLRFGSRNFITSRGVGDLALYVQVFQNYQSKTPVYADSLIITQQNVQWQNEKAVARVRVPRSALIPGGLVSITFYDRVGDQRNLTGIPLIAATLGKKFVVLEESSNLPLFRHYLNPADKFRIVTSYSDTAVSVLRYKPDFPPALPPMSLSEKNVSPTIPVMGNYSLATRQVQQLTQPGLFALQPNQGSAGILLLMENEYPELTTPAELIDPLIYITTTRERLALLKADNPKIAIDKFWLSIGGSEQFTRTLIRAYYSRVVDANKLFSSHKPGWMSDRGMIYIVMGRPSQVNSYADREEWIYTVTDNRPTTQFTFLRRDHDLTQNHYELVRDPVFEPVWYSAAEQWRKGIIDP